MKHILACPVMLSPGNLLMKHIPTASYEIFSSGNISPTKPFVCRKIINMLQGMHLSDSISFMLPLREANKTLSNIRQKDFRSSRNLRITHQMKNTIRVPKKLEHVKYNDLFSSKYGMVTYC